MKKSKKIVIASLVTGLSTSPVGPRAHAQNDMPPPPDFDNSFPPPGSFPAPGANNPGGSAPAVDDGVLTNKQKAKFNSSGIEDITNQNFPETIESFDFPSVEITDIIKTISELTGKNFIIDPGVRGKITIVAPSKITVAEAYKAFLSALAINGFTVVPSGAFLKVKNARNAQRDSIETYSGAYYPNDDQMITRIIHLKHISAEIVQRELRILPSKDGELSIYSPTNSIILSDYGSNIDRVMKIINQLDVPGFEEQIEVVRVKHAKAKDMAELIDKIVNKGQKSGSGAGVTGGMPGSFAAGVPRFTRNSGGTAQGQSGNSFFMAIPDDRTNSIIVVGNRSGIVRVKRLVAQLDFPVRPDAIGGVYVYYVKYGDAEKIAQVLQNVTKEAAPKAGANTNPGGFPGFGGFGGAQTTGNDNQIFGGDVKVSADKNTNSLVVTASKQDYDRVLSLLGKIDIPRDQVFVEANIMEMSINDGMDYKVGYYQYDSTGSIKGGFNGGLNLAELLSPLGGSGAILPFGQGGDVPITDPTSGKTFKVKSLTGFFNFLKTNTRLNVLSNPTITALNNEEATIEVGDRVATSIQSSVTSTGLPTQTATFEDATLKLKIKPFINPTSDTIRMEVDQSIKQPTSNIVSPKALTENTLTLATRSIKTNIVVESGNTAILGGLLRDSEQETIKKVPLLGDLPIIGWLFKSRNSSRDKVNLVVFLTPKVLRSKGDNDQVIGRKLDERLEFVKAGGGKDPFGRKIDEIQKTRAAVSPEFSAPSAPSPFEPQDSLAPEPMDEPAPVPLNDGAQGGSTDLLLEDELSSADSESSPAPSGGSQQFHPGLDEGVDEPLVE